MKVALVYDRVNKFGGAEQILKALHSIWPNAPLYTSVYNSKTASWAKTFQVKTSFLQNFNLVKTRHELFAWVMPYAFESFNFNQYQVVISITSAEAKGIITKPKTLHICYLLTPTRYLWSHANHYKSDHYTTNKFSPTKPLATILTSHLRTWDQIASTRPDKYIAISETVSSRAKKYYHRQVSKIIYPPCNIKPYQNQNPASQKPYYLLVSRLVPYKNIQLAIETFNSLNKQLIIIGQGSQRAYFTEIARKNVKILGTTSESRLAQYYQGSLALVFPSEEDFGIVCVEAQQFGKPVIALRKGGATETIIDGKTGIFFDQPTTKSLTTAIKRFEKTKFNSKFIQNHAQNYSLPKFKKEFKSHVEELWQAHEKTIK